MFMLRSPVRSSLRLRHRNTRPPSQHVRFLGNKSAHEVYRSSNPLAKQLQDSGVWPCFRNGDYVKPKAKVKADKLRVNIVGEELCDDVIKYIAPNLERHVGCDLIDINPGVGLWSNKINNLLRPRSHILFEPDVELYEPYLQPLLEKPGTKLIPSLGYVWDNLEEVLSPAYLPHQVEIDHSSPEPPPRNDKLLVLINMAHHPKKRFRLFPSIGALFLNQLVSSIRSQKIFQKYGLVRMLLWIPDDEKVSTLPRSLQTRRRQAFMTELTCESVLEVAGADQKPKFQRDRMIDTKSARNTARRMQARGIVMPPGREPMHHLQALGKKEFDEPRRSGIKRPYVLELEELEARLAGVDKSEADPVEWKRRKDLRFRVGWEDRRGERIMALLAEKDALLKLHIKAASGRLSATERAALRAREAEWNRTITGLEWTLQNQLKLAGDNLHVSRQDPPAMLWDQRDREPLAVRADEFFPCVPCTLLDMQPAPPHELLRTTPQSSGVLRLPGERQALDLLTGALLQSSTETVSHILERIYPGAAEGMLPNVPSLVDPRRGGCPIGGFGALSVRALNTVQIVELLEAWTRWPGRPRFEELASRMPEDEGGIEDEREGNQQMREAAML